MAPLTSWTRLEPRVRRDDPAAGLEARVRDPLWLVARQWQVGELTGEDAGSPLQVRVRLERAPLTRYLPGLPRAGDAGARYDAARLPLDVAVECERAPIDLRLVVESGLHFLRLLEHHGLAPYRQTYLSRYALQAQPAGALVDDQTARLLRVSVGRVPDGARLAADLRAAGGALPAEPVVAADDRERVLAVTRAWLAWLDGLIDAPAGDAAWASERMEYAFSVAAPASDGEHVFVAPEYARGHLDWYAFDRHLDAAIGAHADAAERQELVRTAIPAPVGYRGMPVARWWEFEDGQVNFGTVDAGPTDLLRLLFLSFALDYGNDWFLLPVELPADAAYRVTSLVVTDSFGERTLVRPYTAVDSSPAWRMFRLSIEGGGADADDLLFVPPSLPGTLRGEPIEQVVLLRDEVANLAWAVERTVPDAGGRPLDRFEQFQATRRSSEPASSAEGGDLRYRLSTAVPDFWLPLVPVREDAGRPDVRLVRGRVLLEGATGAVTPAPLGRLLEPGRRLALFEEEVTRAGVRLARRYQYARWSDGSAHLWLGREKGAGRGEGASGLRFDSVMPSPRA
jgi:hypothetical protein